MKCLPSQSISKSDIKQLLSLAQGDREKECLRYVIYKTSGMSQTCARRQFGFEKMKERSERVQNCIDQVREIRQACDKLARIQESCIVNSESSHDELSESEVCIELPSQSLSTETETALSQLMVNSKFNWFEF